MDLVPTREENGGLCRQNQLQRLPESLNRASHASQGAQEEEEIPWGREEETANGSESP